MRFLSINNNQKKK